MPHDALLQKWLTIGLSRGPADDAAAIEFIRATWGHRGYDAWIRDTSDGFPPFALIAEGEPRLLLLGYLRFSTSGDPHVARRGAMAMLLALENLLKAERRDLGVLIAADELQARRLAPVLPPLDRLVDCVAAAETPAPVPAAIRHAWPVHGIAARPLGDLAGGLAYRLTH
jgi:hypothetical protein